MSKNRLHVVRVIRKEGPELASESACPGEPEPVQRSEDRSLEASIIDNRRAKAMSSADEMDPPTSSKRFISRHDASSAASPQTAAPLLCWRARRSRMIIYSMTASSVVSIYHQRLSMTHSYIHTTQGKSSFKRRLRSP